MREDRTPYGYRIKQHIPQILEEDPDEQAVCKRIVQLYESGLSLRDIADILTKRGPKFRGRKFWYFSTVHNILERMKALQNA